MRVMKLGLAKISLFLLTYSGVFGGLIALAAPHAEASSIGRIRLEIVSLNLDHLPKGSGSSGWLTSACDWTDSLVTPQWVLSIELCKTQLKKACIKVMEKDLSVGKVLVPGTYTDQAIQDLNESRLEHLDLKLTLKQTRQITERFGLSTNQYFENRIRLDELTQGQKVDFQFHTPSRGVVLAGQVAPLAQTTEARVGTPIQVQIQELKSTARQWIQTVLKQKTKDISASQPPFLQSGLDRSYFDTLNLIQNNLHAFPIRAFSDLTANEKAALDSKPIRSCETGTIALHWTGSDPSQRTILLCPKFFKKSPDAQVATLIHEMTHFTQMVNPYDSKERMALKSTYKEPKLISLSMECHASFVQFVTASRLGKLNQVGSGNDYVLTACRAFPEAKEVREWALVLKHFKELDQKRTEALREKIRKLDELTEKIRALKNS